MYSVQYPQYQPQYSGQYSVLPDVKFKRLPFFDIMSELVKPSPLVPQNSHRIQQGSFCFRLTPAQVTDIAISRDLRHGVKCENHKQVQMRFCLLDTTCEQEDFFPPNVIVKVNNMLYPLPNPVPTNKPGVEPKRPPTPVNISPLVNLSPTVLNTIHVSWASEYTRAYAITVSLVHKRNSQDLLQRLKTKGTKHSDYTRGLIKKKFKEDADWEIATTSLNVSLLCPLGKMRMSTPCRAITCQHLQCFDASLFLQMNERKPTWSCPVCDKPALYDHLVIDGYFQEVLSSSLLSSETNEIQLNKNGSWNTHTVKKKPPSLVRRVETPTDDLIEIISDDIAEVITFGQWAISTTMEKAATTTTTTTETEKENSIIDLTLSDSEDDDDEPLAKHNPKPDSRAKFSTSHLQQSKKAEKFGIGDESNESQNDDKVTVNTADLDYLHNNHQQRKKALSWKISSLEYSNSQLQTTIRNYREDVYKTNTEVTRLKTETAQLQATIEVLYKKISETEKKLADGKKEVNRALKMLAYEILDRIYEEE